MMRRVKKFYFTLLELLIVLFIISFGVILTGVKVKAMYQEQRFLSESQQILSHLAMAQDLMLIMDADVMMKFAEDPESKQITFWLEVDKPLEERWARFIERKVKLSAIQSYKFQRYDEKGFEGRHEKELALQFALGKMSQGTLTLFEGKEKDHALIAPIQIDLPGYPSPLTAKAESSAAKELKKAERSKDLYPAEVYKKLYENSKQEDSGATTS